MQIKLNPLLMCDFYKTTHEEQYPKDITKIVSYFTPRMSRLNDQKYLIMFGLQGFIKQYLIEYFQENFFNIDKKEILDQYNRILDNTLGKHQNRSEKVGKLHDLGYLPISIKSIAEGTKVPIQVPMFEISNTLPDFAWLVNTLETLMSCNLWHPMISANVGYRYRQIINQYYDMTVDDEIPRRRAIGDFSMRGQESYESATRCSAAFCLSFVNTATVPSIDYLERYYNSDCTKEEVAFGAVSTEHSVMNTNFAFDGDEITMVKRLLTEIYPKTSFSMVSDSYDYWNLVENILPQCKNEILNHQGYLGIRGDSGDPVEITVTTVEKLWKLFGGTKNTKGFKVLIPQLRVIYGDSITPQRCEEIYSKLKRLGFASNNVIFGAGSFSMQCIEDEGKFKPYTRDTYGIAIKATYAEKTGLPVFVFKNPKTDSDNFKKSHKGCCIVYKKDNELICEDQYNFDDTINGLFQNELKEIFRDGIIIKEQNLKDIRNILHCGKF